MPLQSPYEPDFTTHRNIKILLQWVSNPAHILCHKHKFDQNLTQINLVQSNEPRNGQNCGTNKWGIGSSLNLQFPAGDIEKGPALLRHVSVEEVGLEDVLPGDHPAAHGRDRRRIVAAQATGAQEATRVGPPGTAGEDRRAGTNICRCLSHLMFKYPFKVVIGQCMNHCRFCIYSGPWSMLLDEIL